MNKMESNTYILDGWNADSKAYGAMSFQIDEARKLLKLKYMNHPWL